MPELILNMFQNVSADVCPLQEGRQRIRNNSRPALCDSLERVHQLKNRLKSFELAFDSDDDDAARRKRVDRRNAEVRWTIDNHIMVEALC